MFAFAWFGVILWSIKQTELMVWLHWSSESDELKQENLQIHWSHVRQWTRAASLQNTLDEFLTQDRKD